jgi:phosphatidylinositol alpha-mannosyltransferase
MKVGLFHSTLPEQGRKPGGVEVFVHRLGQNLTQRGHEVTMYSFFDAPEDAVYRHTPLQPSSVGKTKAGRLFAAPLVLNSLDAAHHDVLHLHGDDWFFVKRALPTVRTFYGSALCEARHATSLRRAAGGLVAFPLELMSARLATRAYGITPGWERLYRLSGTLSCGVAVPAAVRQQRDGPPSLLFVGTWNGRKRGRFLHDVFCRDVVTEMPTAELWMVSDYCPPSKSVKWIKTPSDAELVDLYQRAWAFCLPSTYEGFGIPYVEAMAQATPVIASPNVGARHVLDEGRAGMVVRDDELGDALVRLLSDAGLRTRFAHAGRERAQDFAWDLVVAQHERAYEDAIERWQSSRRR